MDTFLEQQTIKNEKSSFMYNWYNTVILTSDKGFFNSLISIDLHIARFSVSWALNHSPIPIQLC